MHNGGAIIKSGNNQVLNTIKPRMLVAQSTSQHNKFKGSKMKILMDIVETNTFCTGFLIRVNTGRPK